MNKTIALPHSANQKIPVEKVPAAWIIWGERFHRSRAWEGFHFPFDWQTESLSKLRLLGPFAKSSRCCSWMGIDARL
jgi:hypothetical protein